MNPFPEFHIPPAEAAILQRLINAGAELQGEEAIELQQVAAKLRQTIREASDELEAIEKRYAELKSARDTALREFREYYVGEEPGDAVEAKDTPAETVGDFARQTIGSASDVSDEEVAAAQAEESREAEADQGAQDDGPDPVHAVG